MLDNFFGFNIMRNAVSHYGMTKGVRKPDQSRAILLKRSKTLLRKEVILSSESALNHVRFSAVMHPTGCVAEFEGNADLRSVLRSHES